MRTYLYKLTSDRGGAPCAPPPLAGRQALLTLSICKPAIRRTAQPGDRIVGITSAALATREGYPVDAVIYAAVVARTFGPREYYKLSSSFRHRPDCIYRFDSTDGTLVHSGKTALHQNPAYIARDIGHYPYYRNARTLVCEDFRYFGPEAVPIPHTLSNLLAAAQGLGQGHRVFDRGSVESTETDTLFKRLWRLHSSYTPAHVEAETYDHASPATTPKDIRHRQLRSRR
jgi:Nucleotide modification associated domain 2